MAVKAINNSVGLDGIIPILLVFGAYPRITNMDPPLLSIIKRAEAICVATKEVQRLYVERQVNNTLAIRNGLNTKLMLNLLIYLNVCVWRKKGGWKGLYRLLVIKRAKAIYIATKKVQCLYIEY